MDFNDDDLDQILSNLPSEDAKEEDSADELLDILMESPPSKKHKLSTECNNDSVGNFDSDDDDEEKGIYYVYYFLCNNFKAIVLKILSAYLCFHHCLSYNF